ncbi:MAG: DNA polymerase domain-containing protein [Ignisphaera sp.]|uniref:DNA-directed DNA polymerase n=1 Tax=Ignisphaera aggregans TaxID=334771 RepID=A0A7C4NNC5_9CREN
MAGVWVLDAFIDNGETFLTLYEDGRGIKEEPFSLYFYGYIEARDSHRILAELENVEGIDEAKIEFWSKPPFYTDVVDIVVFKTKSYKLYKNILRIGAFKGLKAVNMFPHPLVEALYRAKLRPLTTIEVKPCNSLDEQEFDYGDPKVSYIVVDFQNGYYTVRTQEGTEEFWYIRDLTSYILAGKFLLGFTDPYIYIKLIDAEPKVSKAVYRWIIGGVHHPLEYFEWSRLSYIPLSLMKNITIGKILTTIEALVAREKNYIVNKTFGRAEPWRPIRELIVYDRGGVVHQPKPGLYWDVCQIDFSSLYPNIIVRYNVSGETIDKNLCSNKLKFPWSTHNVCVDKEGIVSASIKKLIDLKERYDLLMGKTGEVVYKYRKSALKWILVASFGYLGYRNSLFGSVMAHEFVTSTSREILRRTRIAIEKEGYRVVHAIVDSVFIENVGSLNGCEELKNIVEKAAGFKAKVEAYYLWLYIPQCTSDKRGTSNKYYGLLFDGSVKMKGIMAIRRDIPLLIKKAQLEALGELFKAKNRDEFRSAVGRANNIINGYIGMVKQSNFDPRALVVTRSGRIRREGYSRPPRYVVNSSPPYRLIYVEGRLIPYRDDLIQRIDLDKYISLLEKTRRELPSEEDIR